jgi:hypothetical protein
MRIRIFGWLAVLLAACLLVLVGYVKGASDEQASQRETDAKQMRQAFEQGQAFGTVRDVVVKQYVDRVQVVKEAAKTIIKEVPVYVSKESDAHCAVPVGFVRLHDAAAAAAANVPPVASPAGVPNDARSGIALSTVAGTVADNYESAHLNAEQLKALQQWARDIHAIATGNAPEKK